MINVMVSCVNSYIPDERQCFNTHHGIERFHIGSVRDCFREGIMVYCFPLARMLPREAENCVGMKRYARGRKCKAL